MLTSCIIREISILSPSRSPAEPLAHVALVRQVEPKPAASEKFIYGDGTLIRRYFDNAIVSVGGVPVRASSSRQLHRSGADYVIDHPHGSQTIYSGSRATARHSAMASYADVALKLAARCADGRTAAARGVEIRPR